MVRDDQVFVHFFKNIYVRLDMIGFDITLTEKGVQVKKSRTTRSISGVKTDPLML